MVEDERLTLRYKRLMREFPRVIAVAIIKALNHNRDRIMGVEAFHVVNPYPEVTQAVIFVQLLMQASGGIFAEHQVLPIESRKFLLIFALYSRLNRCFQGIFNAID
jgi:hypothetical protein